MGNIFEVALEKFLRRFSVGRLESLMHGICWGLGQIGISYENVHAAAQKKVAEYTVWLQSNSVHSAESQRNSLKMYAEDLWCIIYFLIAKTDNMGYWRHESGLMNCQSAVFFLDYVVENLTKIVEDLTKTAKKIRHDDQSRSLECVHLVHSFTDLRDKITGIRNYINRGI